MKEKEIASEIYHKATELYKLLDSLGEFAVVDGYGLDDIKRQAGHAIGIKSFAYDFVEGDIAPSKETK